MTKYRAACSFYLTNSCKKGDLCPFYHDEMPEVSKSYPSPYSSPWKDPCADTKEKSFSDTKTSCDFWTRGYCAKGAQCPFVHESVAYSSSYRQKPQEFTGAGTLPSCPYWSSGKCNKGAQCKFLHDRQPHNHSSQSSLRKGHLNPPAVNTVYTIDDLDERGRRSKDTRGKKYEKFPDHHRSDTDVRGRDGDGSSSGSVAKTDGPSQDSSSELTIELTFLDGVRVLMGPGGAVKKVITSYDSCRVILANIPEQTTHQEVLNLADAFGRLKSVELSPPGTGGTAKLDYLDSESAKTAAETLNDVELHSQRLVARLDLRSGRTGKADFRSSTLRITWFSPIRQAYAHYSSESLASSKAIQLDGKLFAGRIIEAVMQTPSYLQTTEFTVVIRNLPLHINLKDLEKFCGAEAVKIGQATYHCKDGIARIQEHLNSFGPVENFDWSHSSINDIRIKALVRFARPEDAACAAEVLQGQSHSFLGGAKTWATRLHSIKYNISNAQHRVLKDDLHRFDNPDAQSARLRVYGVGQPGGQVCIRIYGEDPKSLCLLKTRVEALILGDEVMYEGASVWDDYFLTPTGKAFLDEVRFRTGAYVRLDLRRRHLRVGGSYHQKDRARNLLLGKYRSLIAERHNLSLTLSELQKLLRGQYLRLQGILGEDKVYLYIRRKTLTIRGDDEDIQKARQFLWTLKNIPTLKNKKNTRATDCPVCFCEVTTPVELPCRHIYCFSCLRHFLTSAESFPVNCLGKDGQCDFAIPLSTIKCILPVDVQTRFFENAFLTYVRQRPKEYQFCPTPDCQQIYRPAEPGSILRCPSCLSCICPSCHVEFHEGLTCAEHRDNGGNLAYEKWKEENNVKSCPSCKADIEKSAGCNHLTCLNCRSHICWVCLQTWSDSSMIYDHMLEEHAGIGL